VSLSGSRVYRVLEPKHPIEVATVKRVGFENVEQLDAAPAVIPQIQDPTQRCRSVAVEQPALPAPGSSAIYNAKQF
jgi:hypothetical protein